MADSPIDLVLELARETLLARRKEASERAERIKTAADAYVRAVEQDVAAQFAAKAGLRPPAPSEAVRAALELRTAVENVRNAKALVLRVSPKAAAVLRQHKKDLMDLIGRAMDVAIKEDPEVEDIGCIIQTEFGTIDAQLMTQLQMLKQVLTEQEKQDGPK